MIDVELLVDEICDRVEWDFYYNVYLPRTEEIKILFNKIELNCHGLHNENNNGSIE